ncbi:MAG: hypothetical protein P4L83_08680 [Nevskia sp.]|nr:hypothetical protein [Nevskia sp.]
MSDAVARQNLQTYRVVLAFFLTPMLPGFYATIFFAQPWAFPIGALVSYPAMLLCGVPLFLLARHRNWLAWWQMALCGMVCAVPVALLYRHFGTPPHLDEAFDWINAVELGCWGGFAGVSFWLLAVSGTTPVKPHMLLGLGI